MSVVVLHNYTHAPCITKLAVSPASRDDSVARWRHVTLTRDMSRSRVDMSLPWPFSLRGRRATPGIATLFFAGRLAVSCGWRRRSGAWCEGPQRERSAPPRLRGARVPHTSCRCAVCRCASDLRQSCICHRSNVDGRAPAPPGRAPRLQGAADPLDRIKCAGTVTACLGSGS